MMAALLPGSRLRADSTEGSDSAYPPKATAVKEKLMISMRLKRR